MNYLMFDSLKEKIDNMLTKLEEVWDLCDKEAIGGSAADWSGIVDKLVEAKQALLDFKEQIDSTKKSYKAEDNKGK